MKIESYIDRCVDVNDFKLQIKQFKKTFSTSLDEKTLDEFLRFLITNSEYRGFAEKEMHDFQAKISTDIPNEIVDKINKAISHFLTNISVLPNDAMQSQIAKLQPCYILNLSDDILQYILSGLTPNERFKAKNISKRFSTIVNPETLNDYSLSTELDLHGKELNSRTKISAKELSSLLKKYPHITSIKLPYHATTDHLQAIIEADLQNLKKIHIEYFDTEHQTGAFVDFFNKYKRLLYEVSIQFSLISDLDLQALAGAPKLTTLILDGLHRLSSIGIKPLLSECRSTLKVIEFKEVDILDDDFKELKGVRLEKIKLHRCNILTSEGLSFILKESHSTLEELDLCSLGDIQGIDFGVIGDAQKLRVVNLESCPFVKQSILTSLFTNCSDTIEKVSIINVIIDDDTIKALANATRLREVHFFSCINVTCKAYTLLFNQCNSLVKVKIAHSTMDTETLQALARLPRLEDLDIGYSPSLKLKSPDIEKLFNKSTNLILHSSFKT